MPNANDAESAVMTVTIPLEEYKKLVKAENALIILMNSIGKFGSVDTDTLKAVTKTIDFQMPEE